MVKVSKKLSNGSIKMGYNSEIEPITIHPQLRGIETIKQKTMETMEKEHREKMIEMAILLSTLATLVVMFVMVFGVVMLAMR